MTVLLGTAWPISESVVERLGWVLVHSLWQFALVALLAGVFVRALRRNSATTRYGLLVVAMAVLLTAPVATWMLQPDNAPDRPAGRVESIPALVFDRATSRLTDTSVRGSDSSRLSETETVVPTSAQPTSNAALETVRASMPAVHANNHPTPTWLQRATTALRPWLAWLVAGWGFGVVVCSLRPLLGWQMLGRLRRVGVSPLSADVLAAMQRVSHRLGLRRAVHVLQSTLVQVPVVIGYVRPMILLPVSLVTSLPAVQLDAILAHELAHVRRHDFVINLLQTVLETIFFYHPAVWWLSRQVRVEREHCCDDLVVEVLGNRVEYGRALLAIEERRGGDPILALGAADGSLLSRVRRILGVESGRNAVSLVGRGPAALLGLTCLGAALALSMNWNLAAKEEPILKAPPVIDHFGPESDGLRCRLVALPTTVDDTSPDITKVAKTFARGDDVTFAVELKNVSEKPVTLLGVRHGNGQPGFDGKLYPEFFAPHLFEFDFTDADGKPVPRSSRIFFGMYHLLSGASAHEIPAGKSLFVVLRPARFHAPMDHQLPPGSYRAKIRYRGPGEKTLAYLRESLPDKPHARAWSKEVTSNEVAFTVAEGPVAPKPAKLVWGAVKDGLQAAVELRSPQGIAPANDPPGALPTKAYVSTIFHVKNVSDHTITFVSETARQMDEVTATNEAGETQRLQGAFFTGEPILVRWTLKPGEIAELHALTAGIGLIETPGKYTLRYRINFGSLSQAKGEGEFGFPKKDDWQQVLVPGDVPVTIRARTADDDARENPTKASDANALPKSPNALGRTETPKPGAPEGEIEKVVLKIPRTPFQPDPEKGSRQGGTQIVITLDKDSYDVGEPIVLTARVTNGSKTPLEIELTTDVTGEFDGYSFQVRNGKGELVKKPGDQATGPLSALGSTQSVAPGEASTREWTLNYWAPPLRPGKYSVKGAFQPGRGKRDVRAESQAVSFEVLDTPLADVRDRVSRLARELREGANGGRIAPLLGFTDQPEAIGPLIDLLYADADPTAVAAARALLNLDRDRVKSSLLESLKGRGPRERLIELLSISLKAKPKEVTPLLVSWLEDKNGTAREAAVEGLRRFNQGKDAGLFPKLARMLEDPLPQVRQRAAAAVGEYQDAAALKALKGVVRDHDSGVAEQAVIAVGWVAAAAKPDSAIRTEASDLLRSLLTSEGAPAKQAAYWLEKLESK